MLALIVPETIPLYDDVDPDELREAAREIRAGGAEYANDATDLDRSWRSGTDTSYLKGAGRPTLLEVLHPVARRAVPVDQALQQSAKVLDIYADSCEKIKKALKRLRADAEDFVARMKRLEAHGEKWDQYPANVEENDRLKAAVGKQETAFTEAESLCSGSIQAAYGADSGMSGPPPGHPAGMPLPEELKRMGREAAELAKKAAAGDEQAYTDLTAYRGLETNPEFATAFIGALGAAGLVALPRGMKAPRNEGPNRYSKPERKLLAFIGGALATATKPKNMDKLGPTFLQDLQDAGRRTIPGASPTGSRSFGYHGLAAILGQKPKGVSFSPEFMKTVGRDMIDFDRDVRSGKIRVPAPGPQEGTRTVPDMASYLPDLMHAVEGNRDGAQILLDHTPDDYKTSNLHYLLHEQADVWTDDPKNTADDWKGKALGAAMEAAMVGKDPTSTSLTAETIKILGRDVPEWYDRGDNEKLKLVDEEGSYKLAGIRGALGKIFAAHIDEVVKVVDGGNVLKAGPHATSGVTQAELDFALMYASGDEQAFKDIISAQREHMRSTLAGIYPLTDKGPEARDAIANEADAFGHILQARKENLLAAGRATEAEIKEMQEMVRTAMGMVPVPGREFVGGIAENAFKGLDLGDYAGSLGRNIAEKSFDLHQNSAFDKAASWINDRFENGKTLDEGYATARTEGEIVTQMMKQMLASDIIAHGQHDGQGLTGASFAKNGKIRPLVDMTPSQYRDFIEWALSHSRLGGLSQDAEGWVNDGGKKVRDNFHVDD